MPQMYRQNRLIVRRDGATRGEQGSVAAEHDHEVGLRGNVGTGWHGLTPAFGELRGDRVLRHRDHAAPVQVRCQFPRRVYGGGLGFVNEQSDGWHEDSIPLPPPNPLPHRNERGG